MITKHTTLPLLGTILCWLALSIAAPIWASEVSLTKSASVTSVPSGEQFLYTLRYSCVGDEPCDTVVITDEVPAELSGAVADVQVVGNAHTASTAYDPATRTATWNLISPLEPGSTGEVQLGVKFPQRSTPDGTVATNQAEISASAIGTIQSGPVSVTATAASNWTLSKSLFSSPSATIDETFTYLLYLRSNSGTGLLNLNNVVITDTLPAGAEFVSASDGGTESGGIVTWPTTNLTSGTTTSTTTYNRYLQVRFPASAFSPGDTVTNNALVSGDLSGGIPLQIPVTLEHPLATSEGQAAIIKQSNKSAVQVGEDLDYSLYPRVTGNKALDALEITDEIPVELDVTGAYLGVYASNTQVPLSASVRIELYYQTASTGWTLADSHLSNESNPLVDLDGLGVTGLRWTLSSEPAGGTDILPPGFNLLNSYRPQIFAKVRSNRRDDSSAVEIGDIIRNTATCLGTIDGSASVTCLVSHNLTVTGDLPYPFLRAYLQTNGPLDPGAALRHRIFLLNYAYAPGNLSTFALGVLLDPKLSDAVAGSYESNRYNLPAPTASVTTDYDGTGQTLATWSWENPPSSLAPGQYFYLFIDGQIADDALPGPVAFQACVLTPDPTDAFANSCSLITDVHDLNGNGDRTDKICCHSAPTIDVASVGALNSELLVKGELDADFFKGPGNSVPGGGVDYQLRVENVGNVTLSGVVITDILPFVGDTGVASTQPRESAWLAEVTNRTVATGDVTTSFSTEENPCRGDMNPIQPSDPTWPTDCAVPDWISPSAYDGSLLDVRALRFEFYDGIVSSPFFLEPAAAIEFEWSMQVAANAPTNGEFGWNSFAFRAAHADDTEAVLLPSEPGKVGVQLEQAEPAIFGDYAWIDEAATGNQVHAATNQGLNNVDVDLYLDNGDGVADPQADTHMGHRITHNNDVGDPGYYQFSDLSPGNYFALFTPPAGYEIIDPQAPGTDAETDSDPDPVTGLTPVTRIDPGEVDLSWDLGLRASETGAVGDRVWFDVNGDGTQNEPVLRGINCVTVELYRSDDLTTPIASMETANDINGLPGYFRFTDLNPGVAHQLRFALPADASFTSQHSAGTEIDSDADPSTGFTDAFTLSAGEYDATIDAGILLPSGELSLGDRVWIDADGDGIYHPDDGEIGIDNVRVDIYRDLDGSDTVECAEYYTAVRTFTSGGAGYYEVMDLPQGEFIAKIEAAAFAPGETFDGLHASNGSGTPAPDPDNDLDDDADQNARDHDGGVITGAISLDPGAEPDGDHNATLDLGLSFTRSLTLAPAHASLTLCDTSSHQVIATALDEAGNPRVGITIDFDIVSGPNQGTSAAGVTNANGETVFSWNSNASAGTDRVVASTDSGAAQVPVMEAAATAQWTELALCDLDASGVIDINDVRGISRSQGQASDGACDARDLDRNGLITINDARGCVLRCDNPRCAP